MADKEYKKSPLKNIDGAIHCQYDDDGGGELAKKCGCPKECIYNPTFQSNYGVLKLCRVGYLVDPKEISPDKKGELTEKQLEITVQTGVSAN